MKIFANKNIWRKIVLIFITITILTFVTPVTVQAATFGGNLMKPVVNLLVGVGDGFINVLHKVILKQQESRISIVTYEGSWFLKIFLTVVVVVFVAGVIIGVPYAIGAISATIAASLKVGVITLVALAGGIYSGAVFWNWADWTEQCDLPLYSITPEEIFRNEISLFDVNFFNPTTKTTTYTNSEIVPINGSIEGTLDEIDEAMSWESEVILDSDSELLTWLKKLRIHKDTSDIKANGSSSYNHTQSDSENNSGLKKVDAPDGGYHYIKYESINNGEYGSIWVYSANQENSNYLLWSMVTNKNTDGFYGVYTNITADVFEFINEVEGYNIDRNGPIKPAYINDVLDYKEYDSDVQTFEITNTEKEEVDPNNLTYTYTPDKYTKLTLIPIGSEKYKLEYTFYTTEGVKGELPAYSVTLSGIVSKWYNSLRIIAIVGMMSVLVFIGIKILLSSTASQKAKYKQLLGDWFIGMVLLFVIHYIMVFANEFVSKLTDMINSIRPHLYSVAVELDDDFEHSQIISTLQEQGYEIVQTEVEGEKSSLEEGQVYYNKEKNYILWNTNLMGYLRMEVNRNTDKSEYFIGYAILFIILVIYTFVFVLTYLKRLVTMAFLTIIAPLVALTYPIDKANDGKAQGFDIWIKEYMFNLLLQPIHLLLYTILVTSAIGLAMENPIYAIVAIGFMVPAEKLLRKMFNFSKASTPGTFGGAAGAALTMSGIRWLTGHGPKGGPGGGSGGSSGGKEGTPRDADGKKITSTGTNTLDLKAVVGNLSIDQNIETSSSENTNNNNTKVKNDNNAGNNEKIEINDGSGDNISIDQGNVNVNAGNINPLNLVIPKGTKTGNNVNFANNLSKGTTSNSSNGKGIRFKNNVGSSDDSQVDYAKKEENKKSKDKNNDDKKDKDKKKELKSPFLRAMRDGGSLYASGMKQKMVRSLKNAQPLRTAGRLGLGALGATALGTVGFAAGVTTGDPSKVAQYAITAAAGGFKLGGNTFDAASNALDVDGVGEELRKGYVGVSEYKIEQAEKAQKIAEQNEQYIKRIQEKFKTNRKDAKELLEEMVPFYYDNKITNIDEMILVEKTANKISEEYGDDKPNARYKATMGSIISRRYNLEKKYDKREAIKERISKDYENYGATPDSAEVMIRWADIFNDVKNKP